MKWFFLGLFVGLLVGLVAGEDYGSKTTERDYEGWLRP